MEVATEEVRSENLDHHGIVAAMCQELGIAEKINDALGPGHDQRVVSAGTSVVAMILNGLGFTNRRLYLTHQFFENKPLEKLLGQALEAKSITDYTLAQTLDEIAEYGASELFGKVAFAIALEHNLLSSHNHLDTTSLSVHGQYDNSEQGQWINLTHGHSKDHRPDLKQAVLSLVVNGPSEMPLWMEALDGNSSDKASFHETIKRVHDFQSQIALERPFKWIADSALYSKDKLLANNEYCWLCRVPETINEAKEIVSIEAQQIDWVVQEKGYRTASYKSNYGGIEQRWVLVYSEQAYQREKKTLLRKLDQQQQRLNKQLWHLSNEVFQCKADAHLALKPVVKKYPHFVLSAEVETIERYPNKGRPREGAQKEIVGYRLVAKAERNEVTIAQVLNTKGRFILATNDLDMMDCDHEILQAYKEQQKVERGFRFLKDPWFMVDSVFLKLPRRIEALMMVMSLCLLVYNLAQYRLRQALKDEQETLPNQLSQPVQNPTLRWIFQLMEGISIVYLCGEMAQGMVKEFVTNLTDLRKKIIRLFGDTVCQMYGLIPENPEKV